MKATVPRGWRKAKLGEIVEFASGQVDPREHPYADMLHVGGDNIESGTGRLFGMQKAGELGLISGKYLFDDRDILYSKIRPYLNKVATPAFEGVCSADIYPLRPRPDVASRAFVARILRTSEFLTFAESCSSRTSIPKVNRESLVQFECALPPLPEQKRIAAILDKADEIRRKRAETIQLTEELLKSAFLEMFGDPVTNPKGWPVKSLELLADIGSGVTKGRSLRGQTLGEIPYMRVANVQDGHIDLREVKTIEISADELERFALRSGDVLLTEGGDPDKLGRGAVWRGQIEPCIHQNHIFRVRIAYQAIVPEYLSALIGSEYGKKYFLVAAKQTTGIATINKTQLRAFPVQLPPRDIQEQYIRLLAGMERLTTRLIDEVERVGRLTMALTQQAFRGEL